MGCWVILDGVEAEQDSPVATLVILPGQSLWIRHRGLRGGSPVQDPTLKREGDLPNMFCLHTPSYLIRGRARLTNGATGHMRPVLRTITE